ncbi:hypothetical protein LTR10_017100 [Elasticomyces elasticus]|uniref:Transcription factor domain-containing protein n=1 Tax=Exophiala sideris TaxID=1016849 RepID=A0ABR0JDX6_9EURO|nr:hypothetical protein LTR10_017100 [Elasticomyces elasticus]KAK5032602.1 hypothetical protein LTS07_004012 [Exophiala sideris]KAK5037218.1 hypothetical protein LTR13_005023 [Exophiala sideris]KAK5062127.1 hypothetical protein LTR69_004485 [Exophiala sideris]KAK5182376.1 hypothetical protein LTR44_005387 [Eurotiomycetes sp. CCFEE 6388]
MASLSELVRDKQGLSIGPKTPGFGPTPPDELEDAPDDENVDDTRPPAHLQLLFENLDGEDSTPGHHTLRQQSRGASEAVKRRARSKLQLLLPTKDEVWQVTEFAPAWMAFYHSLFPAFFACRTEEQLRLNYEHMCGSDANPTSVAMYLLYLAITSQQLPANRLVQRPFAKYESVEEFVNSVCTTVRETIVDNDDLAGTAEGLELTVIFIRLLMGRGSIKSTWLIFRRVIALGELIGLPQAFQEIQAARRFVASGQANEAAVSEQSELKAGLWDAICATDRNFSMMLNIPTGTARYKFPLDGSIWKDGHISAQAYNYRLSNVCAAVFEIDELFMRRALEAECYEKVLNADQQLRSLRALAGRDWWQPSSDKTLAEHCVGFWHHYILARVHLRSAMVKDIDGQYTYSRNTCWDACQSAIRQFILFRSSVPSGFFVCRILDAQAFTAATFLLLSSQGRSATQHTSQGGIENSLNNGDLLSQVMDCFRSVATEPGSDFAREAVAALTSLQSLVHGDRSSQATSLTLKVPLLGRIHINAPEIQAPTQPPIVANDFVAHTNTENQATAGFDLAGLPTMADAFSNIDDFSWSFEFDSNPYWSQGLTTDNFGTANENLWMGG